MGAICRKCGKDVGCSCKLELGLCGACKRAQTQETAENKIIENVNKILNPTK